MAQRQLYKLADQTSTAATQLSIALPATAVSPATGTATSGMPLSQLDGLLVVAINSGAVAMTQGVTLLGSDGFVTNAQLAVFSPPTAATTPYAHHYGPNMGGSTGVAASVNFSASGFMMDKMTIQATPGAATTVRLVVYGVKYV